MVNTSIELEFSGDHALTDVAAETLVKYNNKICLWTWAGLIDLTGQRFWTKELVENLGMRATILPKGSVVKLIQQ